MSSGDLLTVPEVANTLRVRQETVRIYIKEGYLKAVTLPGGEYRVLEGDLKTLLQPVVRGGEWRKYY